MLRATVLVCLVGNAAPTNATEWPTFRKGVWRFERTLQINDGVFSGQPRVLFKQDVKRCVDPSEAMKETFRPLIVGNCRSTPPQKIADTYVFSQRCDYMGPVRTTINVQNDSAYTEINELEVGELPRTDTVIAHRLSSCD
jgi:hypothetical protein